MPVFVVCMCVRMYYDANQAGIVHVGTPRQSVASSFCTNRPSPAPARNHPLIVGDRSVCMLAPCQRCTQCDVNLLIIMTKFEISIVPVRLAPNVVCDIVIYLRPGTPE